MFQDIAKSRWVFLVAILIGSVGAVGQAYILHHELFHSYPYKMMDYLFYRSIANFGIYLAPFLAIVIGFLFGRKRLWLTPIIPVFLCPLLFSIIYEMASVLSVWNGTVNNDVNFDGTTPAMASQNFFVYSLWLVILGLIVGTVCSFLLMCLSKPRKLA